MGIRNMQTQKDKNRILGIYLFLVIVLMVPFWVFGDHPLPVRINLPVGALGFVAPVSAAVIASWIVKGKAGATALLKRAVDYAKIGNKRWLLAALLLTPVMYTTAYVVMAALRRPLPEPEVPWLMAPVYLGFYLIGAAGEELGWAGVATDPLLDRWGVWKAGALLGLFWATWHLIPWVQTHNPPAWIFWQATGTVLMRMIMTWMYAKADRSVSTAIVYHAASNTSWSMFPNYGSHYDPFIVTVLMGVVVGGMILMDLWRKREAGEAVRG